MKFDTYVGIDWSGDKSNYQRGISVALCKEGNLPPKIIKPKTKYWSREILFEWINNVNHLIFQNLTVLSTLRSIKENVCEKVLFLQTDFLPWKILFIKNLESEKN